MLPPHERPSTLSEAVALAERLSSFIPTLETERLVLRAPRISDFSLYADVALSPYGRFWVEGAERETVWYDFVNMMACWLLRGYGLWAVERGQEGELIGFVLIGFEPGDHEPELGYMLAEQHQGFGYAREAALKVKQFAFEELGFPTLVSTIDPDNIASLKLAERLGGVRDRAAEQAHDNQVLVYRYQVVEE